MVSTLLYSLNRAKFVPDLNEAVESYKAKSESYMAKLEVAEIARAKAVHQENLSESGLELNLQSY